MSEPELSRPIKARQLPAEEVVVEANASERAALARRFDIPAVGSLHASVELRADGKTVRASGHLAADIVQNCAISHEEFKVTINEPVDLRFVEARSVAQSAVDDEDIEIELAADDCDEIEYSGDTFDMGEAIAQSLGLAIDPYAEGPDADIARTEAGIVAEGEQDGPLAEALAALKKTQ